LFYGEHFIGQLAYALDDSVAVKGSKTEGLQDQQIERALQKVGF
jgi:hypothetical protein